VSISRFFSRKKRERDRIRALPKIEQGVAKFKAKYPRYNMGFGSYGLPKVYDWNEGATLTIGAFCSIATDVEIFLGGHHRADWITTYPFPAFIKQAAQIEGYAFSRGDVRIGSDVWLCTGSKILSGVTIGHGAVIGAGAVVSKDVEPYSIVAGNPARHVRYRFEKNEIELLLGIQWWNWHIEDIVDAIPLLCSGEIKKIVDYAESKGLFNS